MHAIRLAPSTITHTRHGNPSHYLFRSGLSIMIDLDKLNDANQQSRLFSVDKFNLLSFHQSDYGKAYRAKTASKKQPQKKCKNPASLANYIRELAKNYLPNTEIKRISLLTFPRILNLTFNPISVFICEDNTGKDCFIVYEVHNTFGDAHSYVAVIDSCNPSATHIALKNMHVSPFFPNHGEYILSYKTRGNKFSVIVRFLIERMPALTAAMRGEFHPLTTNDIIKLMILNRQFPLRPLLSIHLEAIKLFWKKCTYYPKPAPKELSITQSRIHNGDE